MFHSVSSGRDVTGDVGSDLDPAAQAQLIVALMQGLHVVARTQDPLRLRSAVDAALANLAT